MKVWVDGTLHDARAGAVSPLDHGLLTGDGVFETLRVYAGMPFAWRRHLERLGQSARGLGLAVPPAALLRSAASEVLTVNGLLEARLRITVTGGPSPLGSARGGTPPTIIVAASPLAPVEPSIAVATSPWPRNERGALAGLKTISYGENVAALAYAHERGADEAIFPNTLGNLCEGTGTNVFLVAEGTDTLVTPPPSAGCLAGVTRALVIELCSELGIRCDEADVPLGALADAGEAFLTSTTREVQPVSSVDGRPLALAPGPVTARLSDAFPALVARDLDP